jgi:hypothetical protein
LGPLSLLLSVGRAGLAHSESAPDSVIGLFSALPSREELRAQDSLDVEDASVVKRRSQDLP